MERNKIQQNELDKVERKIITVLFGSENIPDKTSALLQIMNINPNNYIRKFENKILPIMKADGSIDGVMLKRLIQLSKYNGLSQIISIPEADFYLSDFVNSLISSLFPGVFYD